MLYVCLYLKIYMCVQSVINIQMCVCVSFSKDEWCSERWCQNWKHDPLYRNAHTVPPLYFEFLCKVFFQDFCSITFLKNSLESCSMVQLSWEYGTSWEEEEEMFDNLNSEWLDPYCWAEPSALTTYLYLCKYAHLGKHSTLPSDHPSKAFYRYL